MNSGERTGRPAGGNGNKERILMVARDEFAAKGFRGTTLRSIAGGAGVDVALVAHYFGGKEALFAATMELPDGTARVLADALSEPLETRGERLTRGYLGLWENPATAAQMQVFARSALNNEVTAEKMRGVLADLLGGPTAVAGSDGRQAELTLAIAQLQGVAFGRYLARIPLLVALEFEDLVGRTAPAIQVHLVDPRAAAGDEMS